MALEELYTIDAYVGGMGPIRVLSGSLEADTDNEIYTPPSGSHVFILSENYSESTTAVNPTYKSGSTTVVTPELVSNQGVRDQVLGGFIMAGKASETVYINPAEAVSSALFHVVVGKGMKL